MAKKAYDSDGNEIKVDEKTDKQRKAAFEQICKKAILVNMNQKQFSNMPFDVTTTKAVAEHLKVTDDTMIQVRKFLFNPERLAKIRSALNDALLTLWNHTRPWDNIGFRLLPMEYYDDFNETFGKIKDEFEEAVREFIDNYDSYLKESKKLLGKAFNKNDYPDKTQLPSFFALEIHTSKFPEIDDVRLNLSGPELVQMQREVTERYDDVMQGTAREMCGLIESGEFDGERANKLIGIVSELNKVVENPEIDMQIAEAKQKLESKGVIVEDSDTKDDSEDSMMLADDIDGIDDVIEDYI